MSKKKQEYEGEVIKKKKFEMPDTLVILFVLRQYRTILSAELRRQIFWQFKQKTQRILCVFTRFFVTTAGKYASGAALKATAMNCAVLP